jgi:hypothetical protein
MSKLALVNELHRQARRNFLRRQTIMRGIDDTLQADLVEMIPYAKQNNNMKYILTVINIFSKMAYARPIKNKTGPEVTKAMESILNSMGHPIHNLHVDEGKEFYNKHMKKLLADRNIHLYSTFTTKKAAICERFNRTLKNKMWKKFSYRGPHKWIDILQSLIHEYNNTKHRTIRMKPIDVKYSDEDHLLNSVYSLNAPLKTKTKFKLGDFVRISKYKHVFSKGYTPNWTTELFKIRKVQQTNPITYLLIDLRGDNINGSFYNEELQKVDDPKLYLVERIIRKKGNKVRVKWLGFDSSHNSWIDESKILE